MDALDNMLIDTNAEIWFVIALVGTALFGGAILTWAYRRRFWRRDLATSDSASGFGAPAGWTLAGVVLLIIAFALKNWFGVTDGGVSRIPSDQQWWNIGAWTCGATLGFATACLGGRKVGHLLHDRGSKGSLPPAG